ncbi:helix-turn-helix domain-containing protein [Enterococcus faecalis]|uniref:helix-turn-helix domain-containing protein n=1 Tax=Enterococcus faecalis TaxID=1351 RepID=UPI00325ADF19
MEHEINFMDLNYQKRYLLLKAIYSAPEHVLSQADLLTTFQISQPTLTTLTNAIQADIDEFDYADRISLSLEKNTKLYHLKIASSFSLEILRLAYLESSIKFKIVQGMLYNDLGDMSSTADKYFITYPSLRRELYILNKYFKTLNLSISTKKKITLEGKELAIRMFFTYFYTEIYGGTTWPFKYITIASLDEIFTHVPKEIYEPTLEKKILLYYFTAIFLGREKQGNHLTLSKHIPLYSSSTDSLDELSYSIRMYTPLLTQSELNETTQILCSMYLAFGSYHTIKRPPLFFYLSNSLIDRNFLENILSSIKIIDSHLEYCLSNEEYDILLYKLCVIHYRIILFEDIIDFFKNGFLWETPIKYNQILKMPFDIISIIISKALAPFPSDQTFTDYLKHQYYSVIKSSVNIKKLLPNINIVFISKLTTFDMRNNILGIFLPNYNLTVTHVINSSVDLIISDSLITHNGIIDNILNKKLILVETYPIQSDIDNVSSALSEIINTKLRKNSTYKNIL